MNKRISTTVKVEETLYNEFKILGVRHKLSLQGLVEKVIYRYVKETDFRSAINTFIVPITSDTEYPPISSSWASTEPSINISSSFLNFLNK